MKVTPRPDPRVDPRWTAASERALRPFWAPTEIRAKKKPTSRGSLAHGSN
jgi:hypothetical protein